MGQSQTRPARSASDGYDDRVTSSDSNDVYGGGTLPPRFVRGIVNEGQSCFVNSTLQALSTLPPLLSYFSRVKTSLPKEVDGDVDVSSFAGRLHMLLFALSSPLPKRSIPLSIKDILEQFTGYFSELEQHDAQEFFLLLMNTVHDNERAEAVTASFETARRDKLHAALAAIMLAARQREGACSARHRKTLDMAVFPPIETSLRNPFEGTQACSYHCRSCNHKTPWQTDSFLNLSLSIPRLSSSATLQSCLRTYFMPEAIHEYRCSGCKETTTTLKSVRLTRLPSLLCLHLQRRVFGPYGVTKDSRRVLCVLTVVDFLGGELGGWDGGGCPVCHRFGRHLDVSDFCKLGIHKPGDTSKSGSGEFTLSTAEDLVSNSRKSLQLLAHTTYHLTAVIRHIGGPDSGHYVVYRRVPSLIDKRKPTEWSVPGRPMTGSDSTASLSSFESSTVSSGTNGNSPTAQAPSQLLEPLQWVRVSDANVEIVDEDEVLECEAYMLFYMRGDVARNGDSRALVVPPWRDEEEQYWYPLITPAA